MFRKCTASALLLASFLTTPVRSEEPPREPAALPSLVTVTATIEYGDVDLATPDGRAEVRRRVAFVVRELCRPEPVPTGLGRGRVDGHCYRQAMAEARAQLDRAIAARQGSVRTALNTAIDD